MLASLLILDLTLSIISTTFISLLCLTQLTPLLSFSPNSLSEPSHMSGLFLILSIGFMIYQYNPDTKLLLDRLSSASPFSKPDILAIHSTYCDYIHQDCIYFINDKLFMFHTVKNNQELLMIIIIFL